MPDSTRRGAHARGSPAGLIASAHGHIAQYASLSPAASASIDTITVENI